MSLRMDKTPISCCIALRPYSNMDLLKGEVEMRLSKACGPVHACLN